MAEREVGHAPLRVERARGVVMGVLCCALLWGVGSGCKRAEKSPQARGQGIYLRSCSGCHGADGRGTTMRTGFTTPPKDLTAPELHERLGPSGIKQVVQVGKGQMSGFGALMAEEDIDAVVLYVQSLKRK